jgi:hypothetical protein
VQITGSVDGFHATRASVSKTCLVRFDTNKYSVASRAVGRPVEIQAYADRIVIRQEGTIVGEQSPPFRPRRDDLPIPGITSLSQRKDPWRASGGTEKDYRVKPPPARRDPSPTALVQRFQIVESMGQAAASI